MRSPLLCSSRGGLYGPSLEADVPLLPLLPLQPQEHPRGTWAAADATRNGRSHAQQQLVHLVRTVASARGPFTSYGSTGQPPAYVNKYIHAAYVNFNPKYEKTYAQRMKPFGAKVQDATGNHSTNNGTAAEDLLQMVITTTQSVAEATLPEPGVQQLQQVVAVCLIIEKCNGTNSRTYCQP